jgi:hypothetical protein
VGWDRFANLAIRLLLATLPLLPGSLSPARAVEIQTLVGFGQGPPEQARYRPESWLPLTVFLAGSSAGGAQLQVTVPHGRRAVTYTRRVSLSENLSREPYHFVLPWREPDPYAPMRAIGDADNITVQLLQDGRKLAEKKLELPLPVSRETYNVLVLTRDGSGLNHLLQKRLGLFHRGYNPNNLAPGGSQSSTPPPTINPNATLQVHYTPPHALPGLSQGYDMMDTVVLGDLPLDTLTQAQQEALKGYVRQGGCLVVSGGGDTPRLKSPLLAELLPITPQGARASTDGMASLGQRYRAPFPPNTAFAHTEGRLKPGSITLHAAKPTITSCPYGSGVVVFTDFDLFAPEFRAWQGAPAFWRDLLRCSNQFISPRRLLESQSGDSSPQLADALAGKQATSLPDWRAIALFLAAYLFLLIPVNYLLLKKLDKRELAWVTIPLLIFGFTAAAYAMASAIKGHLLTVNRAVVVETFANSDQAAGFAQATLYSPDRAAYDITLAPTANAAVPDLLLPQELLVWEQAATSNLTVDLDRQPILRNAAVRRWDTRRFATPISLSLRGAIAVEAELTDARHAHVRVTNHTRYTFKDCHLVNREASRKLGDLPPGATKEAVFLWAEPGVTEQLSLSSLLPTNRQNPEVAPPDVDSSKAERVRLRTALLHSFTNPTQYHPNRWMQAQAIYGRQTNALVGWFDEPILEPRVNGKLAAGEEAALLFVHLPTPKGAPARFRAANPFEQEPIRILEEIQPVRHRGGQSR